MSPLASYRALFSLTGPLYVVVAFFGRLPLAMSQLGTLLLVSTTTDSYGAGGLAAGALAVANALGSPIAGAVADRIGQRPVVLTQSLLGAAGLGLLVALAHAGTPTAALVAVAGLAGLVLPQVGPLARVRWRPITARTAAHQRRLLDAAFSYEGAADEASFVLGPALIGLGAVLISPSGALLVAALMLATFGTAFALHPTAAGTVTPRTGTRPARLFTLLFCGLLAAQMCVGVLFGATQTGTTVLATNAGQPGAAGLIHAVLGIGSVAAGLATVALPASFSQQRRVLVAACALVVFSLPLLAVDTLPGLIAVVFVMGFAVAPYMIGVFSLGERIAPPSRVGTAMTLLAAATGVGYALGSTTAGRLADHHGHTAAFAVTVVTVVVAVVLAAVNQRPLTRALAEREAEPAPVPTA